MKQLKVKEPIKIRFRERTNGVKSIYLDIYTEGKRKYKYLNLYLQPQTDTNAKQHNAEILRKAEQEKQRILADIYEGRGIKVITEQERNKEPLKGYLQR